MDSLVVNIPGVAYIPRVTCGKCNKKLDYGPNIKRKMEKDGKRFLEVTCHGQTERIPFATDSDDEVVLWASQSLPLAK